MKKVFYTHLQKGSGNIYKLYHGEQISFIQKDGALTSSVLIFSQDDYKDFFSPNLTMQFNGSITISLGSVLISFKNNALLRIIEDTQKKHDILLPPCINIKDAENGHFLKSCTQILLELGGKFGFEHYSPPTVNLFTNIDVSMDGSLNIYESLSQKGDLIKFEILSDCYLIAAICRGMDPLIGSRNDFLTIEHKLK